MHCCYDIIIASLIDLPTKGFIKKFLLASSEKIHTYEDILNFILISSNKKPS